MVEDSGPDPDHDLLSLFIIERLKRFSKRLLHRRIEHQFRIVIAGQQQDGQQVIAILVGRGFGVSMGSRVQGHLCVLVLEYMQGLELNNNGRLKPVSQIKL